VEAGDVPHTIPAVAVPIPVPVPVRVPVTLNAALSTEGLGIASGGMGGCLVEVPGARYQIRVESAATESEQLSGFEGHGRRRSN
jgi:hypothetical protein